MKKKKTRTSPSFQRMASAHLGVELSAAISKGDREAMARLIERLGPKASVTMLVHSTDEMGRPLPASREDVSPFSFAVEHNPDMLPVLSELGLDPNVFDVEKAAPPLFYTVGQGDLDGLKRLLDIGCEPNACDKDGRTALFAAVVNPAGIACIEPLLAAGCDCNAQDRQGMTPLALAIFLGSIPCAMKLLECGASAAASSLGAQCPSFQQMLILRPDADLLRALVAHGMDIDEPIDEGYPLLYTVLSRLDCQLDPRELPAQVRDIPIEKYKALLDALLDAGARIDMVEGEETLQLACMTRDADIVRRVLDAGATVWKDQGSEALAAAIELEEMAVIDVLLDAGANFNDAAYSNLEGGVQTAVARAVNGQSPAIVRKLLKRGADLGDSRNLSALETLKNARDSKDAGKLGEIVAIVRELRPELL